MSEEGLQVRALAVIGASGAGKTCLIEALLQAAGAAIRPHRPGEPAALDPEPEARRHGVSVGAFPWTLHWDGPTLCLLDTPGYLDFEAETRCALHAADCALVAVDAAAGVEVGTEVAWRHAVEVAGHTGRPRARIGVICRLDRLPPGEGDPTAALRSLGQLLGRGAVAVQLPVLGAKGLQALLDLVDGSLRDPVSGKPQSEASADGTWQLPAGLPADLRPAAESARQELVELAAEHDDELLVRYLDGQPLPPSQLVAALRRGVAAGAIMPVFFTAALAPGGPQGIRALGDGLAALAPAPPEEEADAGAPLRAICWKTVADPYVGRLSLLRVLRGTLRPEQHPVSARAGRAPAAERVGQILCWNGAEQRVLLSAGPGAVVAVPKLQHTLTGDTLADPADASPAPWSPPAPPLFGVALRPHDRADEERLGPGLQRLLEEDPGLALVHEGETRQTVLRGGGEMHVEVALARLQRKFGVRAATEPVRVAFRETVRRTARGEGKHKKQTGGHGQYGHVIIEIAPLPRGAGFAFKEQIFGGAVPRQYIPAVEKGLHEAMEAGVLAGYPVTDLQVTLLDGSYHPVDSSELAFKLATHLAFREACRAAGPVLLEPYGELTVLVPEDRLGDVMGDLNRRRARIQGVEAEADGALPGGGRLQRLRAEVPLVEAGSYAVDLRSLTGGRGRFTLAFARYEEAAPQVVQSVLSEAGGARAAAE